MTATLQTTIVQLLHDSIEHCSDLDQNLELDLTDEQRADLNNRSLRAFEQRADAILAPYGCTMLGNGDIIRVDIEDKNVAEWDEEAVREELSMIDTSDVLDEFLG